MDVCLTWMSAFLHHLAARQLSIKHITSCDLQEEEHRASKEQHPEDQDQRRAQNQNQDQDQQKIPDQQTVGTFFLTSFWSVFLSFVFSTLFLIFLPQVPQCIFSSSPDISAGMHCVRCPAILALVALALCGPGVSSQLDRDQDQYQDQDLDLELRHHRLLQRARSAGLLSQVREPTTNQNAPFLMKKIHFIQLRHYKSSKCPPRLLLMFGNSIILLIWRCFNSSVNKRTCFEV